MPKNLSETGQGKRNVEICPWKWDVKQETWRLLWNLGKKEAAFADVPLAPWAGHQQKPGDGTRRNGITFQTN